MINSILQDNKKIKELEKCIGNTEEFMAILKELGDKSFWLSVTTKDLYYWIEVLNKVDSLFGDTIDEIKKMGKNQPNNVTLEDSTKTYKNEMDRLSILLNFTVNLLRECNSRSIYNSSDVSFDT